MQAREYIRNVYEDLMKKQPQGSRYPQGAFLAAALEIMREIESPLKEQTLVRLAVLELTSELTEASRLKAAG